jgi:valyl-tRNA synthetase
MSRLFGRPLDPNTLAGIMVRARRELAKVGLEIQASQKKLDNPDFISRAPAEVVEQERSKLSKLRARREELARALESSNAS